MSVQDLQQLLLTYSLLLPRIISCFVVLPVLAKQTLGGGLVRNGVACSLALFAYPIVAGSLPPALGALDIALLIGKEVLLGLLIGFVATIPFWAMEATGFIIDNQRGAALASTLNPSLGSQTSPTGLLLTQTLITLFFSGGAFLALVGSLFRSYASWPVSSFFPQFGSQWVAFFYAQFSQMLMLCALFAAPLLIAMFLAEFGLALISRFAPSLNVFILAMPIKSLVASLLLVLYLGILMEHAYDALLLAVDPLRLLRPCWRRHERREDRAAHGEAARRPPAGPGGEEQGNCLQRVDPVAGGAADGLFRLLPGASRQAAPAARRVHRPAVSPGAGDHPGEPSPGTLCWRRSCWSRRWWWCSAMSASTASCSASTASSRT